MLKFLRGGRRTAAIWWLVIFGTAVTFIIGFSVAPNLVGGRQVGENTHLGSVNGEPITQAQLQQSYQQLAQSYVAQYKTDPHGREESALREQAWSQLVTERAILHEAKRLGLTAADEEVLFAVRNTPPPWVRNETAFQTNGQFDPQKYAAALSDPGINWAPLEAEVRRNLPGQKLEERILSTAKFSEPELRQAFVDQYEKAQVTVARWAPSPAPIDTTKFTDAVLRSYYQSHPGLFSGRAEAKIEIVMVPKRSSPEDDRTALDQARSIAAQARSGSSFAELARTRSEDPSAERGGDLGRDIPASQIGPEIAGQAKAVVDSTVLDPIRQGNKYYVLQIRRVGGGKEPLYRIRQIIIPVRFSEGALREDLTRLAKVREQAKKMGLGRAAAAAGWASHETNWFGEQGFVPELMSTPQAQQFALLVPKGTVSPIYDQDETWTLVQVKDRRAEGLRPFEDVRSDVRRYVEASKRLEPAMAAAQKAMAAIRSGTAFEEAAKAAGATAVEQTQPFSRAQPAGQLANSNRAIGVSFGLPVGQVGGPIEAMAAVLLIRKDAAIPPPTAGYDSLKTQVSRSLLAQRQNQAFASWLDWIRSKSKIEDSRADLTSAQ